jgi:hypothetical protein
VKQSLFNHVEDLQSVRKVAQRFRAR